MDPSYNKDRSFRSLLTPRLSTATALSLPRPATLPGYWITWSLLTFGSWTLLYLATRLRKNWSPTWLPKLAEKVEELSKEKTAVLIQLLDNNANECLLPNGDHVLPSRVKDGEFHACGELRVISKDTLRDHCMSLQPIFKAVRCFHVILLKPFARCLWMCCHESTAHITNSEKPSFLADLGADRDIFLPKEHDNPEEIQEYHHPESK